jgi:hypothetical protein
VILGSVDIFSNRLFISIAKRHERSYSLFHNLLMKFLIFTSLLNKKAPTFEAVQNKVEAFLMALIN